MEKMDLFCAISSAGVPYTRENYKHIGYFDIITEYFEDLGYDVSSYNLSCLSRNHTWNLKRMIRFNYDLATVKGMQRVSVDNLRNTNGLFKFVVPKKFKEKFEEEPGDKDLRVRDLFVQSSNPIFIYSGGLNDLFTFIKAGPAELMNKDVRENLPNDIGVLIKKAIQNVEENFNLLISLNPEVQIYALGIANPPIFGLIQKIIYLQNKLYGDPVTDKDIFGQVVRLFDQMLRRACEKYDNVCYVDIEAIKDYCAPFDFHPNTEGNEIIADKVLNLYKQRRG